MRNNEKKKYGKEADFNYCVSRKKCNNVHLFFGCLNYYETVIKLPSIFLTLNIAAPL